MTDQFIDESVQKPGLRFWLSLLGATTMVGLILFGGYTYLSSHGDTRIRLSGLQDNSSTSTPTADIASGVQPASKVAAPTASLASEKDPTSGFQALKPSAWKEQSQDGFVFLRSDECGSISVLFYPVVFANSAPKPSELLPKMAHAFLGQLSQGTEGLRLGSVSAEGDNSATALLSGTICSTSTTGTASLTVSGNRGLLKVAWYPEAQQQALTNTITQVLQSYKSVVSTAVFQHQGSVFQLPVPDGWLFEQSERSASAHSGDRLLRLSSIDFSADQTLDSALDHWLEQENQAGRPLEGAKVERSLEQSGDDHEHHRYNTKTRFLIYQKDGKTYQGSLTAAYTDALGNTALIYWRTAPRQEWYLAEPTLLLLEQGALYTAPDTAITLHVPVYATWQDASPLTGNSIRATLASDGEGLWQPLMLQGTVLTDSAGEHFIAPPNAQNPQTGTYRATNNGQPIDLTPVKDETQLP